VQIKGFPVKISRRLWLGAALAALAGAGGLAGYRGLVRLGVLRYNRWDRRERGRLRMGDSAPDLALPRYDGGLVQLSQLWGEKPVVLVFGSCT